MTQVRGTAWAERVFGWSRQFGWAWTVRHKWVLTFVASVASFFLAIGVDEVKDLVEGVHSVAERSRDWELLWIGLGVAVVLGAAGWVARRGRDKMLERNGTAFVVLEEADDWADDQPAGFAPHQEDDFYERMPSQFADLVNVPGPEALAPGGAGRWGWPLDDRAARWDEKLMELVWSFRAVYLATAARTNAVFITAWAPVALAFGLRSQSMSRKLTLHVWQRSSDGRAGRIRPEMWKQRGHQFRAGVPGIPGATGLEAPEGSWLTTPVWDANLTVSSRPGNGPDADESVAVLLIRFVPAPWGPLPRPTTPEADEALAEKGPVELTLHDRGGVIPVKSTARIQVHELRCVPEGGQFKWKDFPYLVATAAEWIGEKTAELAGPSGRKHTLLLATSMPNEVALGLGLSAGRESVLEWPDHLWPVVYRKHGRELVTPRLDLGTEWPRD